MKKLCTFVLCLAVLISMAGPTHAQETENLHIDEMEPIVIFQEKPYAKDGYYPFVFSNDEYWQFWRDYIGNCEDCEEGYFYVQNRLTKEVQLLLPEKVDSFCSTLDWFYCITERNIIVKMDYNGENATILYQSNFGEMEDLEYYGGYLFFVDGAYIVRLSLINGNASIVADHEGFSNFYPYATDKVIQMTEQREYFTTDMTTNTRTRLGNESALSQLRATNEIPEDSYIVDSNVLDPDVASWNLVSLPLEEYGVGEYFTNDGTACVGHDNCKYYGGGRQCLGFACYVSDQFAHLTYNPNSALSWFKQRLSCKMPKYDGVLTAFTSSDDVRQLFVILNKGAYVRMEWGYPSNWATNAGHSFVCMYAMPGYAVTYDCNVNGVCDISLQYRDYVDTANNYDYVLNYINHSFTENFTITSIYHYAGCTGCEGYCAEAHYTRKPLSNACDYCGYVGPVDNTMP